MKTWEMIKELTEHPEKKFATEFCDGVKWITFSADGAVRCKFIKDGEYVTDFLELTIVAMTREWEEVREPVPFMDAARSPGKVSVSHPALKDDEIFGKWFFMDDLLNKLSGNYSGFVIRELIIDGEWYIE